MYPRRDGNDANFPSCVSEIGLLMGYTSLPTRSPRRPRSLMEAAAFIMYVVVVDKEVEAVIRS